MPRVRLLPVNTIRLWQAVDARPKGRFIYMAALLCLLSLPVLLIGCEAKNQSDAIPVETTHTDKVNNIVSTSQAANAMADSVSASKQAVSSAAHTGATADIDSSQTVPPSTRDHPLQIDWTQIDSKVTPVAVETFNYPLPIDSASVKAYADFAKVTPKQAQHTLTVSTASNEAVVKLLDQLGDSYVSHKVTDDGGQLIVYTTPNVAASHFGYVLADDFARGLVLPIEIQPQPQ